MGQRIEDYGVIGDLHTMALAGRHGGLPSGIAGPDAGMRGPDRLVARRIPLHRTAEAIQTGTDDMKVVIDLQGAR